MGRRFVYFYFMKSEPDKLHLVIPLHTEYWKKANLPEYVGGPFADRSGGLITFEARNLEEATSIIMNDPFVVNDVLDSKWLKEWIPEN